MAVRECPKCIHHEKMDKICKICFKMTFFLPKIKYLREYLKEHNKISKMEVVRV